MSRYQSRDEIVGKAEWEGGTVEFIFGYGLKPDELLAGTPEGVVSAVTRLVTQSAADLATFERWLDEPGTAGQASAPGVDGGPQPRPSAAMLLTSAADSIGQALGSVNAAHLTFLGLDDRILFDPGPEGTGAGYDALARLGHIAADLRDVARIIENRQLRQPTAAPDDGQ